jgi:uncharacterized membrane protein
MEEILELVASNVALAVETVAVLIIAFGAIEALFHTLSPIFGGRAGVGWRRQVWVRFGTWLLLALQFALAADIVRSAITPGWQEIGELAAIAAIRTFLNFFLERDITELSREEKATARAAE